MSFLITELHFFFLSVSIYLSIYLWVSSSIHYLSLITEFLSQSLYLFIISLSVHPWLIILSPCFISALFRVSFFLLPSLPLFIHIFVSFSGFPFFLLHHKHTRHTILISPPFFLPRAHYSSFVPISIPPHFHHSYWTCLAHLHPLIAKIFLEFLLCNADLV